MQKILLIDDEADIREILRYTLEKDGFEVFEAENGIQGLAQVISNKPDLIVLDVMMPGMDGIEVCEEIRKMKDVNHPLILMLTARIEDYSQISAFDAGADDYVTKPVKPKVLASRIQALLRRKTNEIPQQQLSKLIINRSQYLVSLDGKELQLPRKEFELLALLASEPNKVFERDFIMEKVWGTEVVVGDRTIDVHIRKLREKIGDSLIKTVIGVGYKYVDIE
jgi:two-component system, OmpR family, alkaline phosphatase synthesis response regulator PhoP